MVAPSEVLLDRTFDLASLSEVRTGVYDSLVRVGAPDLHALAFTTSVGEGMNNAIQHGGGRGELTVRRDGSRVVAEIRDHADTPPFELPTQAPPPDRPGGRGLWMAAQLCDRVQILKSRPGTSLILELRLPR